MRTNKFTGLLLILFGTLYLAFQVMGQMGIVLFHLWDFWPLILITLGVLFEALYFSQKKSVGFLIPGGFITTIGVLHLFETVTNWRFAAYTWPIYVLAIFIGFFQVYLVTKKQWAFIVSFIIFCITTFLSLIAFGSFIGDIGIELAFSVIVILIGLVLLFGSIGKYKK